MILLPADIHDLQIYFIVVRNHGMICPGWWHFILRLSCSVGVVNQDLPAIVSHLKLIQIKRGEVIHEVAFHLTTEYVDLRTDNVEGMTIPTRGSWAGRQRSRPLSRGYIPLRISISPWLS
jgi:hypothetical protein